MGDKDLLFTRKIIEKSSYFVKTNIEKYFIKKLTRRSFKENENYIKLEEILITRKNRSK